MSDQDAILDKAVFSNFQSFYNSCINETEIDSKSNLPLVTYVSSFKSKYFPLSNTEGTLDFSKLTLALAYVHDIDATPFFVIYVGSDEKNPNVYNLTFIQSGLVLDSELWYKKAEVTKELENVVSTYFQSIANLTRTDSDVLASDIVALETRISEIFLPR